MLKNLFIFWKMLCSRFLAVKEPAQKKEAGYGTLFVVFIPTGSYGNLDSSETCTAVRSLYRKGMCKMFVSCQSTQGQLKWTGWNLHPSPYMIIKLGMPTWVLSNALGKQTNKHGEDILFLPKDVTEVRVRKSGRDRKDHTRSAFLSFSFFFFVPFPPHKHLCVS